MIKWVKNTDVDEDKALTLTLSGWRWSLAVKTTFAGGLASTSDRSVAGR